MRRVVLAIAFAIACSSASAEKIESTAAVPMDGDAYFVIGFTPVDARVTISAGEMSNGRFSIPFSWWHGDEVSSPTDDTGFIVAKVHGGTTQAVTKVNAYIHNQTRTGAEKAAVDLLRLAVGLHPSFIPSSFVPCGKKSLVFQVPAGKAMYITNIQYSAALGEYDAKDKLLPSYSSDLETARAFLKTHYPNLADSLEQGTYQLIPVLTDVTRC